MKVVCAWCGTLMKGSEDEEQTSPGICTICFIDQTNVRETVQTIWGEFDIGGEG